MVAVVYLWLTVRKPVSQVGVFLLMLVMVLIAIGWTMQPDELATRFNDRQARSIWQSVHGFSLLIGTVVVAIGFVFGVLYLVKAKRLKQKKLVAGPFRLPSLEWLQLNSERSLLISTTFLASGLASGLLINLLNRRMNLMGELGGEAVSLPWHDPIVWSSGILFIWLLAALIFNLFYSPARQGRKVAYIVVASFLFLVLELSLVLWMGHGVDTKPSASARQTIRPVVLLKQQESLGAICATKVNVDREAIS